VIDDNDNAETIAEVLRGCLLFSVAATDPNPGGYPGEVEQLHEDVADCVFHLAERLRDNGAGDLLDDALSHVGYVEADPRLWRPLA
jgi:hypothetical protein